MKIGIIGNYGHDNNGDEAILSGLLNQLYEHYSVQKEDITIFSNNSANTMNRYGIRAVALLHKKGNILTTITATIVHHFSLMKKLDVLIIGGGGLLMDMYKRDAPLYSTLGIIGHLVGCKVFIYGVGAGPITTKVGTFFIKKLVHVAELVTVRDEPSKKLLQKIGIKKDIQIIGDPAFSLKPPSHKEDSETITRIGVTAVPYFSKEYWPESNAHIYEGYINGMARMLDQVIESFQVQVTLFSTKYPQDVEVTKEIYNKMNNKDHVQVIEENMHPNDLVSFCAGQDVVIGTRLHSLILSIVGQTPIIGIGYHQKVEDFMTTIGKPSQFVHIEKIISQSSDIIEMLEQMKVDWTLQKQEAKNISIHMKNEAEKGIKTMHVLGENI